MHFPPPTVALGFLHSHCLIHDDLSGPSVGRIGNAKGIRPSTGMRSPMNGLAL